MRKGSTQRSAAIARRPMVVRHVRDIRSASRRRGRIVLPSNGVRVESGSQFMDRTKGQWAGMQFLKAHQAGQPITPAVLRTADTLRHEQWIEFDNALVEGATMRLRIVADLRARGLTKTIQNGLAKTLLQYEKISDMEAAQITMDGAVRTENDRPDFSPGYLPLPIIHKDWDLNLRTLRASEQGGGEALDDTASRVAGRKIAEQLEYITINGGPKFGGVQIYGLANHPDTNVVNFGGGGAWGAGGVTGEEILADVIGMIQAAESDRFFGPYVLYVSSDMSLALEGEFKTSSDKTIRQRLLEIDRIDDIVTVDQMPSETAILVQMTADVIQLVEGEPLQTVTWDIAGGFIICMKSFTIAVPLVRSDVDGRSGVVLIEAA